MIHLVMLHVVGMHSKLEFEWYMDRIGLNGTHTGALTNA